MAKKRLPCTLLWWKFCEKRPFQSGDMSASRAATLTEEGSYLAKLLLPWSFPGLQLLSRGLLKGWRISHNSQSMAPPFLLRGRWATSTAIFYIVHAWIVSIMRDMKRTRSWETWLKGFVLFPLVCVLFSHLWWPWVLRKWPGDIVCWPIIWIDIAGVPLWYQLCLGSFHAHLILSYPCP